MTTTSNPTTTRSFEGLDIPVPGTFEIDTSHSAAAFTVRHMVVAKTRGRFTDFSGAVTIADEPLDSSVNVTIQAASITTGDEKRDGHLVSPDFLDAATHPTLTFASTSVRHDTWIAVKKAGARTVGPIIKATQKKAWKEIVPSRMMSRNDGAHFGGPGSTPIRTQAKRYPVRTK